MDTEEMTYVEGGAYLDHQYCDYIRKTIGMTITTSPAVAVGLVKAYGAGGLTAIFGSIPVFGWIIGAYGGIIVLRSAEQFTSALVTEMVYKKGMDVNVGFSWFTPYLKCSARTK